MSGEQRDSVLQWLQYWFLSYCDGDWEHSRAVSIVNLDNPGWKVEIDAERTTVQNAPFPELQRQHPTREHDWIHCRMGDDYLFQGWGGPHNLEDILQIFRDWVESNTGHLPVES